MQIRKLFTVVKETFIEGRKELNRPIKKAAALAVIKNPYAGNYVEDLAELAECGEKLGELLGQQAVRALGIPREACENYGKGAIVGSDGELEHAAAILHPKLGKPFRDAVGGGKAIIPSSKKIGVPGTALDIPLHYKDAVYVRSHYDAMEISIPDAPKADEIVVALVVTNSGRPLPRIGGLLKEDVQGEDGLK